jgi:phage terminase large subunit GpA-like protein
MSEATVDGWQQTDTLQAGHASLPNGLGLRHPDDQGKTVLTGVPANELTASEDRDWLAGTPWHKHVRARIEAVDAVNASGGVEEEAMSHG